MNAITRFVPETPPAPPVHDVYTLTRGGNLARIMLDGKAYQLRITRAGKLILTK
jgi:hemin uptake protein HemP